MISGRSRSAILTITEIIRSFEDHGMVDVFGMYPQTQVFLSILAYSGLQKIFEEEGLANQYYDIAKPSHGHVENLDEIQNSKLMDELAHYAAYASAAYGWKLGFAMKGTTFLGKITKFRFPRRTRSPRPFNETEARPPMMTGGRLRDVAISDTSFFLRKTGRKESEIVASEWSSDTHRPGYVIARDPVRKALVFSIRGTWSFQVSSL